MKLKRKNHSIFLRGLVFAVAFALAVICMPNDALLALAAVSLPEGTKVDYNYITLKLADANKTTSVKKGEQYTIPTAYIGGSTSLAIGSADVNDTELEHPTDESKVKIVSTSVTVGYGSAENTDGVKLQDGVLEVEKVGTYVITYSYTYQEVTSVLSGTPKQYENKFEFKIESTLSNATIDFKNNTPAFIPSIIDLNVGDPNDVLLPIPEITGEDGEVYNEENGKKITVSTEKTKPAKSSGYVLQITAIDSKSEDVDITPVDGDETKTQYKIASTVFTSENTASGKYTIRYAFYDNGNFVTSTTKEINVYAKNDERKGYYENYKKPVIQVSNFPTSAQTGVEITLPEAKGLTSSTTTPANEAVDVYYRVKVRYMSSSSNRAYEDIKDIEVDGVKIYADVVDENGYLKDPSKFKPLQDGWYTFNYNIKDIYGNENESTDGTYAISNIVDETNPTPVIYDASVVDADKKPTYEDATYKLKTNANPNAVVVYAIGIDDNVSTIDDNNQENGVVLNRRIATSLTDLFTIDGYDAYNLIFNFSGENSAKTFDDAWEAMLDKNYLISKAVDKYNSANPEATLDSVEKKFGWLKENNYLVVIDNGNLQNIIDLFGEATFEGAKTGDTLTPEDLKAWLQAKSEEDLTKLGFAYIDYDKTFGATTDNGLTTGQGVGQYFVHYVAIDKSGNDRDISRPIYITSTTDSAAPTLKFSTQLAASYLPEATITFDAPSATDTSDSNMYKRVLYRYLDGKGNLIEFEDGANEEKGYVDLDELYKDLRDKYVADSGTNLADLYEEYHDYELTDGTVKDYSKKFDGYKELTDTSVSSYSIKLSEAPEGAEKLQIVAFTYDDAGNPTMAAMQTNIYTTKDSSAPIFLSVENNMTEETIYQGAEIVLPTLKVADDSVGYMTYEVKATRVDKDSKEYAIDVADSYSSRQTNYDGSGVYTIHAGKFTASADGTYKIAITARDSADNVITYFKEYKVEPRILIQQPQISASLTSGTYQLNDNPRIELPTPTVYYQIPNSITYTEFKKNEDDAKGAAYVVMGVEPDGTASDMGWETNFGVKGLFEPKEVGIYDLQYTVKIRIYKPTMFTFNESTFEGGKYEDKNYFTLKDNTDLSGYFYAENEGELKYYDTETKSYYVFKLEDGKVVTYKDGKVSSFAKSDSVTEDIFEGLKVYVRQSDVYRIEVVDTVKPVITHHDYDDSLTKEQFANKLNEEHGFTVYGIEANEEINWESENTGIDFEWSPVKNSNNVAGFTEQLTGRTDKVIDQSKFGDDPTKTNGTIKITYKVEDMAGNRDTWTKTITVGDNENPVIIVKSGFVKESRSYTLGEQLRINTKALDVTDNYEMTNKEITIKVVDSSNNELEYDEDGDYRVYNITEVGTYRIILEAYDDVGNKGTNNSVSVTFTARAQDPVMTYQVVGTILIVISVVVLAGVIIYFIVSKVKLDKELKKK